MNLCVYIAAMYFLLNRSNGKDRFRWTMITFATLLFAGATMMTGAGIKMDQIILVDSQVNTDDPNGAVQSFDSKVLLFRLNLFLNGVYIATNFIADILIVSIEHEVFGHRH